MGTRETLSDLNSLLFEQMERISNDDLTDEEFQKEIQRTNAISGLSKNIINNAALVLNAAKFNDDKLDANTKVPALLGVADRPANG